MNPGKGKKYKKILRVGAKLISQKHYNGASLQEIANKVGLHKSSLFHYFKNKEELVLLILKGSLDELMTNLEKIINSKELKAEGKLKEAIHGHLSIVVRYSDNLNIFLNEFRSLSRKNQAIYMNKRVTYEINFRKIIKELNEKGHLVGLDTKVVTAGLLSMLNSTPIWFKKKGPLSIGGIANIFYRMIVK